ncbi:MAG: ATP-binding protein [Candidatus Eremiobacteraeota bacterium]|nr:ATP-binding protein [Candidatus Eremiobacteraeota bacterium]
MRYPNALRYAAVARRALVEYCRSQGLAETVVEDLRFAGGEAIANALEHGHREGTYFAIRCSWRDNFLIVEVEDDGPGFRHEDVDPASRAGRGFGLTIMRELSDKIEYAREGRVVRLYKQIKPNAASQDTGENAC